jgi:hypothetical protein
VVVVVAAAAAVVVHKFKYLGNLITPDAKRWGIKAKCFITRII